MTNWTLGVIGGSGLYDIDGLEEARWETIESPFGAPSDQLFRDGLPVSNWSFCPVMHEGTGSVQANSITAPISM